MGKGRKGRRQASRGDSDAEEDDDEEDHRKTGSNNDDATPPISFKDMDFAQRRALQRQQATAKRKSKQKCYLCGQTGHVRRECPGIADDGRGMSHYKGKSDHAAEKHKLLQRRQQQRRSSSSGNYEAAVADLLPHYPDAFCVSEGDARSPPLHYYDLHCDVRATIEYLRYGRGKAKISQKVAVAEYRQALFLATGLRAMISQTFLPKPGRPWINPMTTDLLMNGKDDHDDEEDQDLQAKVFFVLGLTEAFSCSDDDTQNEATESLLCTVREHPNKILAIGSVLDLSAETVKLPGKEPHHQVQRLIACWHAAGRANVPWQLQLLPGAASLGPDVESVAGTDYAKVLLEAQEQLAAATAVYPNLLIHLVGWSGKATHLMALLQAFPQNLRAVGLNGMVSFKSRQELHECAFDIPLDRLVMETSTVIPSQVNNRLGRSAFFHSGWWPFVAESVAHHKKIVSLEQVVHAANENAEKLYPQLVQASQKGDVKSEQTGET